MEQALESAEGEVEMTKEEVKLTFLCFYLSSLSVLMTHFNPVLCKAPGCTS